MKFRVETSEDVREFEFNRDEVTFGRGPLNDVIVGDESVARRHGVLSVEPEGKLCWRCKPGATSRFVRNGDELERSNGSEAQWSLQPGDIVGLGDAGATLEILESTQPSSPAPTFVEFTDGDLPVEGTRRLRDLARQLADDAAPGAVLAAFRDLLDLAGVTGGVSTFVMLSGTDEYHNDAWRIDDTGQCHPGPDPTGVLGPNASIISRRWHEGHCVAVVDHVAWIPIGGTDAVIAYRRDRFSPEHLRVLARTAAWIQPYAEICVDKMQRRRDHNFVVEENRYFRTRQRQHYLVKELVSESDAMKRVHEKIDGLASGRDPVLIVGEAGTGKGLLARFLHHRSDRSEQILLRVDCAHFADESANFELFGATEGDEDAGPRQGVFELARGGTVFLQEIDLLPPAVQAKLCRMLKEGEVRRVGDSVGRPVEARLIATVHRDLAGSIAEGRLRRDLFMLLREQIVGVPALRERVADILPLARTFADVYAARYARHVDGFTPVAEEALESHGWPGNVRELQARIESAVLGTAGPRIGAENLGLG